MISVIVLTHNSEKTIKRALASVSWCDEIIVIDDQSTDKTVKIAKEYNAKVYIRDLQNDFASQRNYGLEKAMYEWVLFVDSDEEVTDDLQKEIQEKISLSGGVVGYTIKRIDFMWGKTLTYGETRTVQLLRLAKKGIGKWQRNVHEVWDIQGSVKKLATPLLHYPHPTVSEFLSGVNRYTSINAQVFLSAGKRVNAVHILLYPVAKFIQNYFFRLGMFDGAAGFVHAMMMSFHSFLTRGKMWELQRKMK